MSAGVGTEAVKKAVTKPGELSNEIKRISTKLSCWQCFKLYHSNTESAKYDITGPNGKKNFCSELCVAKYRDANSQTCSLEGCNKKFLKASIECSCVRGQWFCCDEHAEKDPVAAGIIKEMEEKESAAGTITEKVDEENAAEEEEKKELL